MTDPITSSRPGRRLLPSDAESIAEIEERQQRTGHAARGAVIAELLRTYGRRLPGEVVHGLWNRRLSDAEFAQVTDALFDDRPVAFDREGVLFDPAAVRPLPAPAPLNHEPDQLVDVSPRTARTTIGEPDPDEIPDED